MKRIFKILLSSALVLAILVTSLAFMTSAANSKKVVRVGWFDSTFNRKDDEGRRTGYAYEFQQKIASHTGWEYEYVEGSWANLLQMLAEGKIDLMSDVSYTPQRSEKMLFSTMPMGEEAYYLFTTPSNADINTDDYTTFNGKKVGIDKDSVQNDMFKEWAKQNGVNMPVVDLTCPVKEALAMLAAGTIDFYVSPETMKENAYVLPITKIGGSDFYFAVNKNRHDILSELNVAMERISNENPYYILQLYSKYQQSSKMRSYFSSEELKWLKNRNSTIRVGYQDNYLAFCAKDKETGELIGALKDYLDAAADCMENASVQFVPVCFSTSQEALSALKDGKIDCMFPANFTDFYGELEGYYVTDPLMTTEMSAIVQEADKDSLFNREKLTVAVNSGNTNYDMFLVNHFPDWRPVYFKDSQECLKAISEGRAECMIISNYRYNNLAETCKRHKLTSVPLGIEMDYCYAVNRGDTVLYGMLNKMNSSVSPLVATSALSSYYRADEFRGSFWYFLIENILLFVAFLVILLLFILLLLQRKFRFNKQIIEKEDLISATQTDNLTGLYFRSFFDEYANKIFNENPEAPMDAVVLNINHFHIVNSINGFEFGDTVLKELGKAIKEFLDSNGGIASRTEADHYVMYCSKIDNYGNLYNQLQSRLDALSSQTGIQLRMGIKTWEEGMEPKKMVDCAIIACNMARALYKSPMLIYNEEMRETEILEQTLLNDLHRGVENEEFEVYYQPKVDIRGKTNKISGAEALVRWQHPTLGRLTPNQFIPLFERSSKINLLDKYVFEQVAIQAAEWKEKYGEIMPISMNLSRVDILNPLLEGMLDLTIKKNGLSPDDIRLEITESAYIENEEAFIDIIVKLRQKGYRIEMDDFGSAYSSLNMLSAMPIDALKMDKRFVDNIDSDKKHAKVVELIMGIAENLAIPVIAEGVETERQVKILKKIGCAYAQGFYFSPALTAEEFEKLAYKDNRQP